ncbi:MAG: tol-pal system-associated acyl-CoA thioesterase [Ketobacter sp.]|nr:tol-pal system-associated acyl-CoA thioesterase [Ketobacter sp.]MEE2732787.1 tol-pal system-associated acyl-CoA thioesterase [Pseudomonadota bacterium]RLU01502.1 MAG: tol-pal system-associated acyl-CoA thioesterase [Ketobacter sp.]
MSEFFVPVRVYLEDTDAGGIVYYVNYLKFMERARTELLRQMGSEFGELYRQGLQFVVHSVDAQYRKPAQADDELQVSARVEKIARTYILFHQQVRKGDDLMCEARIKVACISATKLKPAPIPSELQQQFADVSA